MADTFTKEERSRIMQMVKSSHNKSTEERLINFLRRSRITGWRRNQRLFGRPDFVLPEQRIVLFADGCFWHGHNCRNTKPKANKAYWLKKISKNKKRDREVNKRLKLSGWTVIRIWECEIGNEKLMIKRLLRYNSDLLCTPQTKTIRKTEGRKLLLRPNLQNPRLKLITLTQKQTHKPCDDYFISSYS